LKAEHPYTPARVPIPHFPVTVGSPLGGDTGPDLLALVDSGADRTLIPAALVGQLRLPEVDRLGFEVGGGEVITLPIYRVTLTVRGFGPLLVEVAASDGESHVLLGRDVLNEYTVTLNGPHRRTEFRDG
jgi:gag-polyprotein putative aspartyl protease